MLAAFPTSGQSAVAFCRAAGVPLATFAIWQREARQSSRQSSRRSPSRASFVRVALATADGDAHAAVAAASRPGVRAVVRSVAGATIALDGLEPATVREIVAVLLAADHPSAR